MTSMTLLLIVLIYMIIGGAFSILWFERSIENFIKHSTIDKWDPLKHLIRCALAWPVLIFNKDKR